MGQEFGKCVKTDSVDDRSGVYTQCTPAPSTANGKNDGGRKKKRFWRRKKGLREDVIDVASDRNTDEFQENQETLTCDLEILSTQDPVLSESRVQVHVGSDSTEDAFQDPVAIESDWQEQLDWDKEIQPAPVSVAEEEMVVEYEEPSVVIQEIRSCRYEIGDMLAECTFGAIYEGTRTKDGLKVAVKRVNTSKHLDYIKIPGHPEPLPREVALHMLACDGEILPEVVKLLDWQVYPDHYIMVLERPSLCVDVREFVTSNGGKLNEEVAKDIMWQATTAAYKCCRRGVFHRDIKMENLLIRTDTLYVKLIDFGCGDLLTGSSYKTFMGTRDYACPEFFKTGEYYGQPATVYSLGVLLFAMVCGSFPNCNDQYSINKRILYKDGLTEECCHLIQACLQEDPEERLDLDEILRHTWFQTPIHFNENKEDDQKPRVRIEEINGRQYYIGSKLGQGGFGCVYKGTCLQDGLKPGHPEPLPREVGLQMLACEGEHVPVIVQFLDWQDNPDQYFMVLERPSPCMDLDGFMKNNGGRVTEHIAQAIMLQATYAAVVCCLRGVFHRDIKLENLLINPDTLKVKMIDFGCGDLLKRSAYKEYMGTRTYTCPEYFECGEYYGKPATVYSLGVLLFAMVCGRFPTYSDLDQINEKSWSKDGLTEECCHLIEACLQEDPEDRIDLDEIFNHTWFQMESQYVSISCI
ncbi:hypothetical protein IRJ41_010549 [Triplophysa rosa]|uniref:non-specific serine/threonine protein kinase n=1 Tax=Triplophysa rosa TaxID=992332 RepID=A0A9W8CBM5_TRIRA|nr:hypothetical protein IRJ41_010549 [Triplophysa rosa]